MCRREGALRSASHCSSPLTRDSSGTNNKQRRRMVFSLHPLNDKGVQQNFLHQAVSDSKASKSARSRSPPGDGKRYTPRGGGYDILHAFGTCHFLQRDHQTTFFDTHRRRGGSTPLAPGVGCVRHDQTGAPSSRGAASLYSCKQEEEEEEQKDADYLPLFRTIYLIWEKENKNGIFPA